ncbi:MAG: lysophospholipid acyltransferase family protein [Chitinispirillales bacterium]|nr:lysophospholipid acyltransferase family protein [Chitinispirillales bacterium]
MSTIKKVIPKRLRHLTLGWMAKAGFFTGQVLPRKFGLKLFAFCGWIFYYFLPKDRKRTIDNLKFIFGQEWCDKKIRVTAKKVFQSIGKNLFDAIKLNTLSAKKFDKVVSHDPLDSWEAAKASGKGAIHVTAHLGCFEMLLHFFVRKGFEGVIVGRPFKNPAIDEVVRRMRSGPSIAYIDRSENPRTIVRLLREGRMMGVLVDQDTTKVEGVFADFLGHPAFTPSSAIKFAMKFNVPIIVSVTARLKNDKHHVFIGPQIERVDTGNFEDDLAATVRQINNAIGSYIRKFPEQWVWMHERWKTKQATEVIDK